MTAQSGKADSLLVQVRNVLRNIVKLDKTGYAYPTRQRKNQIAQTRDGEPPAKPGETWLTPREMAERMLQDLTDEAIAEDERRRYPLLRMGLRQDGHFATRKQMADYIWNWGRGGDSFSCLLLNMISKSDPENRERLRTGFPEMVSFWEEWQASPKNGEPFLEAEMKGKETP